MQACYASSLAAQLICSCMATPPLPHLSCNILSGRKADRHCRKRFAAFSKAHSTTPWKAADSAANEYSSPTFPAPRFDYPNGLRSTESFILTTGGYVCMHRTSDGCEM